MRRPQEQDPNPLRRLRCARGLTQVETAVAVGCACNYYGQLERTPALVTVAMAARIAVAFHVPLLDLLGDLAKFQAQQVERKEPRP